MTTTTLTVPPAAKAPGAISLGRRRVSIELKQFFRDRQSANANQACCLESAR